MGETVSDQEDTNWPDGCEEPQEVAASELNGVLCADWDKLISQRLKTANRFGTNTLVMSEVSVRDVVLEILKMHGIK